jgi:hypothetical protein
MLYYRHDQRSAQGSTGPRWLVPRAFRGERLAIRPLTIDGQYGIFFGAYQIANINLTKPESVGDVSEQVSVMSPG